MLATYKTQGYLQADAEKNKADDEAHWEKRRDRRKRAESVQQRDSSSYGKISSNEFVGVELRKLEADGDTCSAPCDCAAENQPPCDCAAVNTFCSSRCGCAGKCANSFENPCSVIVREVERETVGFGVFAVEQIESGAFISEYVGQYFQHGIERGDQSVQFEYAVAVADGLVINASAAGNEMRFVNHSCRPNAELKKKRDPETGLERVGLYARNGIAPDEEITFEYCPKPNLWFTCACDACVAQQ